VKVEEFDLEAGRCNYELSPLPDHPDDQVRDSVSLTFEPLVPFIRAFTKFGKFECNDSCVHNNQVAFVERLAQNASAEGPKPFPEPDDAALSYVQRAFNAMADNFRHHTSHTPLTGEETMRAFRGQNETIASQLGIVGFDTCVKDPERYQRSYDYWKTMYGVDAGVPLDFVVAPGLEQLRKWANVRPFGKVEYLSVEKFPRNISPRHPHFNFVWAAFTKPLENYFYKNMSATGSLNRYCPLGVEPGTPNPWIGKGFNKLDRGRILQMKYSKFRRCYGVDPIVFATDCTGFDAHMHLKLLKIENKFYRKCFSEHSAFLKGLTSLFETNKLYGDGIKAILKGCRMSGDMHTGLGNSVTTVAMLLAAFEILGVTRFDIFDDGDDCLVLLHPDDIHDKSLFSKLPEVFLRFGHELKIEKVAVEIRDVVWCQSRPVRVMTELGEEYMFVQDPHKIFSTMGSHIHCREASGANTYFGDNLYAYSLIYNPIPFFRALREQRVDAKAHGRRVLEGLSRELAKMSKVKCWTGPNTLSDYCSAFALDPNIFQMEGFNADETRTAVDGWFKGRI